MTHAPRRILVVEDNPTNLELARYLLMATGYEVLTAADGAQGLALARAHRPDLVISDIQMPEMDGYALVGALRADPALRTVPVLALTASTMAGEEPRLLLAGFDAYMTKPFDPREFATCVADLLAGPPRARAEVSGD